MIELKLLISVIFWAQLVNGSQYGSRMRTEALAKSNIDGRIAAILNTGTELPEFYFSKYDTKGSENIRSVTNPDVKPHKITKKYDMDSPEEDRAEMPIIEVNASDMPVGIIFRTNSPKVNVEQQHKSAPPPKLESTRTEEEPHRLIHEVYRPVIQELKEVIQPYRKIVQQIQPVIEEVQQVIFSAEKPRQQTDTSVLQNSLAKIPPMEPLVESAAYQSSSTINQNGIHRNLMSSESPKWLRSTPRSEKNMGFLLTAKETGSVRTATYEPRMHSYFVMGQNTNMNSKNQNKFQNRYLDYRGAVSGLKIDGTVRRSDLMTAQTDNIHYPCKTK